MGNLSALIDSKIKANIAKPDADDMVLQVIAEELIHPLIYVPCRDHDEILLDGIARGLSISARMVSSRLVARRIKRKRDERGDDDDDDGSN